MNGAEFQKFIKQLGLTQVAAASFFGVNETTARRWATGRRPIPDAVSMLLHVMVGKGLGPNEVMSLTKH